VGAGPQLLHELGETLGQRVGFLGSQLEEPVADVRAGAPGCAEILRDEVPTGLFVAREETRGTAG
jgi:hypothetical protein